MALAALVVSVLALVASTASAVFAFRQARAQGQATEIERERRITERTPKLKAEIEDVNKDRVFYRLWLTNLSNEDLESIAVELPSTCVFGFAPGISGVIDRHHAATYDGPVAPGERVCWRIELPRTTDVGTSFVARSRARARDGEWITHVQVAVPLTTPRVF